MTVHPPPVPGGWPVSPRSGGPGARTRRRLRH